MMHEETLNSSPSTMKEFDTMGEFDPEDRATWCTKNLATREATELSTLAPHAGLDFTPGAGDDFRQISLLAVR